MKEAGGRVPRFAERSVAHWVEQTLLLSRYGTTGVALLGVLDVNTPGRFLANVSSSFGCMNGGTGQSSFRHTSSSSG